jgi:hypothetical protein
VLDWRERLVCSECGGREVDFVVTGTSFAWLTTHDVNVSSFMRPMRVRGSMQ